MSIIKNYHHQGKISELIQKFSAFKKIDGAIINETAANRWQDEGTGKITHDFTIAFFGKTGYGKSSTVNAFFGHDVLATSDVEACTRVCNCLDYEISSKNYLSLGDFPGIGESEYRDIEYLGLYRNFMNSVGTIVYVMRADARDHSIDEKAYNTLFIDHESRKKVIIAINQCDKVEPISRKTQKKPSSEQLNNIQEKIKFLQEKFQPTNKIIPYSAETGWNMSALADEMVNVAIKSGELKISIDSSIAGLSKRSNFATSFF